MSSIDNLFNRVQLMTEGARGAIASAAPVFKNVNKQMKAAGIDSPSRDAMLFVTRVLSRTGIISSELHDETIKGQHKDRMEKIMAILRAKEDEINAKEAEIVEFINNNLDNYTAEAGTNRNRAEKYKKTAKMLSQEVQNIKAGKETDDALRDFVHNVSKATEDTAESLRASADAETSIVEINAGNVNDVEAVKNAVEKFANEDGVQVTGNIVEFEADPGSQMDAFIQKNGAGATEKLIKDFFKDISVTVSVIPPASADEKAAVNDAADAFGKKEDGIKGREHLASVSAAADKFLKDRGAATEDNEQPEDEFFELLDDVMMEVGSESYHAIVDALEAKLGRKLTEIEAEHAAEMAQEDELPEIEDAETHSFHTETDSCEACSDPDCQGCDEDNEEEDDHDEYDTSYSLVKKKGKHDDGDNKDEKCDYVPCEDGEGDVKHEVLAACKEAAGEFAHRPSGMADGCKKMAEQYTADEEHEKAEIANNLAQYFTSQSKHFDEAEEVTTSIEEFRGEEAEETEEEEEIVAEATRHTSDNIADIYAGLGNVVIESATIDENGRTSPTDQYLAEKVEEAIEDVYTSQYLSEQKEADSLLVPVTEKRESFKERYQPKTSYQLEELRRYGL